jgi:Type IX secretion system protein PorV
MSYSANALNKDFIPANFALGVGAEIKIDEYNKVGIYTDINKLLIPTPVKQLLPDGSENPDWDTDGNEIADYKEKSSIGGLFSSFGDAPGGFKEEMAEFTIGVGAEYTYNDLFMVRAGYFYENPTKGARKFLSAGAGLKYSVAQLNFAYVIPTSAQRNPLDNTMRFTLLFDFVKGGGKVAAESAAQ